MNINPGTWFQNSFRTQSLSKLHVHFEEIIFQNRFPTNFVHANLKVDKFDALAIRATSFIIKQKLLDVHWSGLTQTHAFSLVQLTKDDAVFHVVYRPVYV